MFTKARRQGTTLIELVVAMAVLAVFLYMATGLAGVMLVRTAAQSEVLAIQGAFRTVGETIVQDGRRAGWPISGVTPAYGATGVNPYIVLPIDNSLDEELAITVPVNSVMHLYRYYLATTAGGGQYVAREDYQMSSAAGISDPFNWADPANGLTLLATDHITAGLKQLTHLYFVRTGGTVTMIFTAKFIGGSAQAATYMTNLFVRNYVTTS